MKAFKIVLSTALLAISAGALANYAKIEAVVVDVDPENQTITVLDRSNGMEKVTYSYNDTAKVDSHSLVRGKSMSSLRKGQEIILELEKVSK